MKILVLGTGMLGSYVYSYLKLTEHEVDFTNRNNFDVCKLYNEKKLKCRLIELVKPYDYIVNCIAITNNRNVNCIDMLIVNSYFPILLSEVVQELNIGLIHPTTDCIYSGRNGSYSVLDEPDTDDVYGLSKFLGEKMGKFDKILTIRTSIIGNRGDDTNLVRWYLSQKEAVNGFTNHMWNGVTCLELAKFINTAIDKKMFGKIVLGCKEPVSKYELLNLVKEVYHVNTAILPVKSEKDVNRTLIPDIVLKDIKSMLIEMRNFDSKIFNPHSNFLIKDEKVVIVTSAINCHSAFTPEERYKHTFSTFETTKKYFPDYKVLFIENSVIPREWVENLADKSDYLIYCGEDEYFMWTRTHGFRSKSLGECAILLEALKHLKNCKQILKLTGRYYLTKSPPQYNVEKFTFLQTENRAYHTTYFGIPINIEVSTQIFENALELFKNGYYQGIEQALGVIVPKSMVDLVPSLDCEGMMSGNYTGEKILYKY